MWSVVNQLASSWPPRGRTWRSTSTAKFPHCNTKRKDSHRLLRGIELKDNKGNQSVGDWQRDKPQRPPMSPNITPGLSQQVPSLLFPRLAISLPISLQNSMVLSVSSNFPSLSIKTIFPFYKLCDAIAAWGSQEAAQKRSSLYHINKDYATLFHPSDKTQIYPKALHISALLHYDFWVV